MPRPKTSGEALASAELRRFPAGGEASAPVSDLVSVEEPLEIRIQGDAFAVTMRTPGHDRELCAGLLLAEGLIFERDDLSSIRHCGRPGDEDYGNVIDVLPAPAGRFALERADQLKRGTLISTSCGICGRRSIDDLLARTPRLEPANFESGTLGSLTTALANHQPQFERSGGLHAAGLANRAGDLRLVREDVGRHNAVDKTIGRALLDATLGSEPFVLVVSGRVSFEIVQKALAAGIGALVAVSAPSSLAIDTARRAGMVLAAFARQGSFNLYSGEHRVR